MANILGGITGFFDKYVLGFALGTAAGPSLEPFVQDLANEAWTLNTVKPPQAYLLAEGVAQGQVDRPTAEQWANEQGFSDGAFAALVDIANVGPGAAYAFQLWRRDIINDQAFRRALRRMGLESEWIDDLTELKNVLLTPAELANARQQGFIDQARQEAEAGLQGITTDRADIQFKLSGLPPGVDVGQRAANRDLIGRDVFDQIVREGHTKTKYSDLLWAMRHPVLAHTEYATLHLKGWISEAEMNAGGALTGYTPEQMQLTFLARGRPAAPSQMATAAARGIDGPDGTPMDEAQFLKGIRESDIRPEWGPMLWHSRFLYPSLFQLTRLVTAGTIGPDLAAEWAKKDRYAPEVVTALHAAWSQGTGATADPHATKAQNQLWTTLHRSYVAAETDDATATATLPLAGADAGAIAGVLERWQAERELIRKQLTPAQIKKAYANAAVNAATDAPWTRDEALAALIERGYATDQASSYLNI